MNIKKKVAEYTIAINTVLTKINQDKKTKAALFV